MTRRLIPYKYHYLLLALAVIAAGALLIAQKQGWITSAGNQIQTHQPGTYQIKHFIDGDTIAVDMNGTTEKVRLIGVDTPETHKPNTPVQCYGPEASAYTKTKIGQQAVRLISDPLSTDRDRYGRLLRYVYLTDGTDLNANLIENGYGFYYPYFPFSKSSEFAVDEQSAIAAHRGLWAACKPTPTNDGGYVSNPA